LTNATFPYVARLASAPWRQAAAADESLARGVNIAEGRIANRAVADTFGLKAADLFGVP
jgi:alanine dehydrogenase